MLQNLLLSKSLGGVGLSLGYIYGTVTPLIERRISFN